MFTQCSQCQTIHRVSAQTLSTAFGQVRCQRCGDVFNALDALADELREDGRFPLQFHSEQPPVLQGQSADESDLDDGADVLPAAHAADQASSSRLSPWWYSGALVLLLALVAQIGIAEREYLLAQPKGRALAERYCKWAGCVFELPRAIDQVALVNRDIRPHPNVEGALLITATIQNRAAFTQAYPQIGIRLSDLDSRVVAERFFVPSEYLQSQASIDDGLAVNTLLPIEFEVVDPGKNAVAFEFSFR